MSRRDVSGTATALMNVVSAVATAVMQLVLGAMHDAGSGSEGDRFMPGQLLLAALCGASVVLAAGLRRRGAALGVDAGVVADSSQTAAADSEAVARPHVAVVIVRAL